MKLSRIILMTAVPAVFTVGCRDDAVIPEPVVPVPQAGVLTISMSSPNTDDGAVLISLSGVRPEDVAPAGADRTMLILPGLTEGAALQVVIVGDELAGPLLRITTKDLAQTYVRPAVVEVSDTKNVLRTDLNDYHLTVQ